ncbi:MAG: acetyl ornithine aminotransferase family protein [Thermoproteota archaeon]|nr:MAG: acetyl ornithine aminotransferase family protein [Candidatus Korarchaeota archaeon]
MVRKPKIVVEPPGPKARELIEMDHQYLSPALTRTAPLVGYEAEGVWVRDPDGNEYLDFGSGIAVTNVGHRHPRVVETVKREVDRLIFVNSCDFYTIPQVHLAKKLTEITPGDFKKRVFFVNSGTEAVECGIKATRYYTQRYYFVGFINGFHGRTMGSLAFTTTSPAARRRFQPMMPGVVHAPYPYCYRCPLGHKEGYPECGLACLDYLENEILGHVAPPDEVAGILFEPVQGAGGYIVPPAEWVKGLRRIADEHGIVLMDDEVQAGMGRTGRWWAVEHFGVEPDVVMISKAIASGFPFGACVARSEILEWGPGAHENTLGGNPVLASVALTVIDIIEKEGLLENAKKVGEHMVKRLREMQERYEIIGDVRGLGLMVGVEFVKDRRTKEPATKERGKIVQEAFKRGLLLLGAGKSSLRLAPPLIITEEEADVGLDILEETIKEVAGS